MGATTLAQATNWLVLKAHWVAAPITLEEIIYILAANEHSMEVRSDVRRACESLTNSYYGYGTRLLQNYLISKTSSSSSPNKN